MLLIRPDFQICSFKPRCPADTINPGDTHRDGARGRGDVNLNDHFNPEMMSDSRQNCLMTAGLARSRSNDDDL